MYGTADTTGLSTEVEMMNPTGYRLDLGAVHVAWEGATVYRGARLTIEGPWVEETWR